MSFQDEYKITNADRLDKGVYGLPDTPGMTTAAIQERFDSLGNLAIDKFNALVEAASDVVDGSDTKFPTNKAVEDYISGEGGAIIDDTTPSLHKAYSSQKVENMFDDVASRVIDDTEPLSNKTYSSEEIEEKLSNIPSPESIIDDDTASTGKTYSSSKLESDFISISDTEEQTATDEFSTINGGLLSSCKVALSPNQDLHGYSEPWVGGAGKNKINLASVVLPSGTHNSVTGAIDGDTYTLRGTISGTSGYYLGDPSNHQLLKSGSYTFSIYPSGNFGGDTEVRIRKVSDNSKIVSCYAQTQTSAQFTLSEDTEIYIAFVLPTSSAGTSVNATVKMQIELGSTATDYEPYSNICPISGHTQVKVGDDGKNLLNPSEKVIDSVYQLHFYKTNNYLFRSGFTYTIEYKGGDGDVRLYFAKPASEGGVYVMVTGTIASFTPEENCYGFIQFTRTGEMGTLPSNTEYFLMHIGNGSQSYEPYNGYQVTVNLGSTYYSGILDIVSGKLTVDSAFIASYNGETLPSTWISDRDVYAVGTTPTTGAEVCYELATPQTIQLTPQQVQALVGENHLSAPLEGQEITESVYTPLAKWNAVIDDTTASDDTTYSSNEIEDKLSNVPITPINDSSASLSSVYSSSKVENLISSIPLTPIDDTEARSDATFSSAKIVELISGMKIPFNEGLINTLNTSVNME